MKKSAIATILFCAIMAFSVINVYASDFELQDVLDGNVTGMGWGGPAIGVWYPNLDGLSDSLGMELEIPVKVISGSGEGGIVPGFSIGGFGGGGVVTKGNAQLDLGFGGFMFNRTFPLKDGHWFYGGFIGGGGAELIVNHDTTPDPSDVDDAVAMPQQSYLKTGFFALGPQVGVQIPVTPFIQFRASAGYLFTIGGEWELVGKGELPGGDVDWSGPIAQVGIVFGGRGPVVPPATVEEAVNL